MPMSGTRITTGISHLGAFIKAVRRKQGVKQREVATSLGVDLATIARAEDKGTDKLSLARDIGNRLSIEFETIARERCAVRSRCFSVGDRPTRELVRFTR